MSSKLKQKFKIQKESFEPSFFRLALARRKLRNKTTPFYSFLSANETSKGMTMLNLMSCVGLALEAVLARLPIGKFGHIGVPNVVQFDCGDPGRQSPCIGHTRSGRDTVAGPLKQSGAARNLLKASSPRRDGF